MNKTTEKILEFIAKISIASYLLDQLKHEIPFVTKEDEEALQAVISKYNNIYLKHYVHVDDFKDD